MNVTVTGLIELPDVTAATCKLELRAFLILPIAFKKLVAPERLTYPEYVYPLKSSAMEPLILCK